MILIKIFLTLLPVPGQRRSLKTKDRECDTVLRGDSYHMPQGMVIDEYGEKFKRCLKSYAFFGQSEYSERIM
jgi:hypothetical protein